MELQEKHVGCHRVRSIEIEGNTPRLNQLNKQRGLVLENMNGAEKPCHVLFKKMVIICNFLSVTVDSATSVCLRKHYK